MSGTTRAITLTLSVRDADKVRQELEKIGPAGEAAIRRLDAAARAAAGSGGSMPALATATQQAGSQLGNLRNVAGQAGYQIQDFVVQVQAGTSALTALSQQGSQFLGAFGATGAAAGAVLTIGLLAAQIIAGADASKALNDALSASNNLYKDLNDSAERRARGMSEEINRQILLRDYLAATTAEARAGIDAFRRLDDARRGAAVRGFLDESVGGLSSRLNRTASGDSGGFIGTDIVPNLVPVPGRELDASAERLRAAIAAIGDGTAITRQQVDELAGALDGVARSNSIFSREANTALQALERQREQLYAAADAAVAAGRGNDELALSIARLARQTAAANIGQSLTAELFQAQQVAAAFARGNAAEARRLTREQEIDQRAQQLAQQAEQEARRSFPNGTPETEIEAAIRDRRDQIARDAARLAELQRRNQESEQAAREAERNARSRSGGRTQISEEEREINRALTERTSVLRSLETPYDTYIRRLTELNTLQDRLKEGQRRNVEGAVPLTDDQVREATDRFRQELDRAEQGANRVDDIGRQLGLTFTSAFEDAILKGKNFRDVLKGIEQDIARLIIRKTITEPAANAISGINWGNLASSFISSIFGGGSTSTPTAAANGAAFSGGNVIPFARGGVVTRPTLFPMADGAGLMGEAGPEAVMPLRRNSRGQLGVVAEGGGSSNMAFNINIDARGADAGVEQKIRAGMVIAIQEAQRQFAASINRGGSVAKTVGRR